MPSDPAESWRCAVRVYDAWHGEAGKPGLHLRMRCCPPTMRPAGGSKPTIDRQVVVLPHPDSPTRPRVSPSFKVKLTPSTALTTRLPRKVKKCVCKCEMSSSGVVISNHLKNMGAESRKPSPMFICGHRWFQSSVLIMQHSRYRFLNCGSSRTRSQSPKSCVANTMSTMQAPGKTVSHH